MWKTLRWSRQRQQRQQHLKQRMLRRQSQLCHYRHWDSCSSEEEDWRDSCSSEMNVNVHWWVSNSYLQTVETSINFIIYSELQNIYRYDGWLECKLREMMKNNERQCHQINRSVLWLWDLEDSANKMNIKNKTFNCCWFNCSEFSELPDMFSETFQWSKQEQEIEWKSYSISQAFLFSVALSIKADT